jgi:hypothetical protein
MDEAGMSLSANFLTRGCDCRMAWKHTDCRTQELAVRRSRR